MLLPDHSKLPVDDLDLYRIEVVDEVDEMKAPKVCYQLLIGCGWEQQQDSNCLHKEAMREDDDTSI
jgi:hypothetical protein